MFQNLEIIMIHGGGLLLRSSPGGTPLYGMKTPGPIRKLNQERSRQCKSCNYSLGRQCASSTGLITGSQFKPRLCMRNGSLTRYVKLRVRNAGNVFPATVGTRSRHASRHVRDARAVMHTEIANWRFPSKSASG